MFERRLLFACLVACGVLPACSRDPVSSRAVLSEGREASVAAARVRGAGLPALAVGAVWTYDVTERTRFRPQDGSAPWSEWTTRRIVREARAIEERTLDAHPYVVLQDFDSRVDPPGPSRVGFKVPHRLDPTGLYHRPPPIVSGTMDFAVPVASRRGGPVGEDMLLLPYPARPADTFLSNRQLGEIRLVERHEPVRTGIGNLAAVRTRVIASSRLRTGDVIVA